MPSLKSDVSNFVPSSNSVGGRAEGGRWNHSEAWSDQAPEGLRGERSQVHREVLSATHILCLLQGVPLVSAFVLLSRDVQPYSVRDTVISDVRSDGRCASFRLP